VKRTYILAVLFLASCTARNRLAPNEGKDGGLTFGDLETDNDGLDFSSAPLDDLSMSVAQPDFYGLEAGAGAYSDLGIVDRDAAGCANGQVAGSCPAPLAGNLGCSPNATDPEVCGNGLDDNCNGMADEGCDCVPGTVQRCFLGPPGKRSIGGCTDGSQTCEGSEFGMWGPCEGSIGPRGETCDGLDDDCNGCTDDGLCCSGGLTCPAPGDPRIADAAPYSDKVLHGGDFFTGTNAVTWKWTVDGGPCDKLFASAAFTPKLNPRPQSYTLSNANSKDATVHFTLSGDYTVTLTVVDSNGLSYTCTWVQHVTGPGVRFEVCWDHQGTSTQKGADLDLHVHRPGSTKDFYDTKDDCYWNNCSAPKYSVNWGYANSPLANCVGSKYGTSGTGNWTSKGYCANPRLDFDNVDDVGVAENSNIDVPNDGDTFRAMVHYYGQDDGTSFNNVTEHPIVNIYCGGQLKATYGQKPDQIVGFNHGSGTKKGQLWRVADVTAIVDASGKTVGCNITQLHEPGTTSGYWVVTDTANTDFTYGN
jgi:hypothetical protein